MTVSAQTKERLIDRLRNELYKKHNWTGETAVNYMVPIILAIRHKDDEADPDAIFGALDELRQRGKRELEDTLNAVKAKYQGVSPLLSKTLAKMIGDVNDLPDGIIYDVLDHLHRNPSLLRAFRDEDFIGTLFERSVSDAFRGDDGRFFTPRNIILIVREMMRLLVSKQYLDRRISDFTVCDPCCGSARFLIYWSEFLIHEIREEEHLIQHAEVQDRLKEIATQNLFGADVHPETAAYGCLNMMLHGDGATNIANLDSLDHFGFFAGMPLLWEFAQEFQEKWDAYRNQPAITNAADLQPHVRRIEAKRAIVDDLLNTNRVDLSDPKWLDVMIVIRTLVEEVDRQYATEWDTIRDIQRRFKRRAVYEAMLGEWARLRNPDIANGFDILITNPPFGRQADLMVDDVFILSQYKLATESWVPDMNKGRTETLLSRTLAKDKGLAVYYIELLNKHFEKEYVEAVDQVLFNKVTPELLGTMLEYHEIAPEVYVADLVMRIRKRLRRVVSDQLKEERVLLDESASDYKEQDRALRKAAQDERNRIDNLLLGELKEEMREQGLGWADILYKRELVAILTKALGRTFVAKDDEIHLGQLPPKEAIRVCAEYLYESNKPNEALADEIIGYFGKDWLTVEDIEGPDGYASKITLVFNGEPHSIYYDDAGQPIVYNNPLPKQVLFIEEFLRMVKPGGKVFTVLDTGVLSNVGDEFVRRFIYRYAHVHAIVEFLHGAFKAAEANVKTAIILLQRLPSPSLDNTMLMSAPQYLGFRLNDKDVPVTRENDLGKVLCDFSVALGMGTLYAHCGERHRSKIPKDEKCYWSQTRVCNYWSEKVDPDSVDSPSERRDKEFEIQSTITPLSRAIIEQRLDPKFYVFEQRFETLAADLSQEGILARALDCIVDDEIHRGCQPTYDDANGTIPVLKTTDVQNRKVDWSACRRVTEEFYIENISAQISMDDIVVTSTGEGSWGRAAICDVDRALADGHLTILQVNKDIVDPYAVLAFLWSEYGRMQFEQRVRGSTGQTEIYPQDIKKVKILIPSEGDQKLIRDKIEKQFTLLERAEQLRQEAIQGIENLLGGAE